MTSALRSSTSTTSPSSSRPGAASCGRSSTSTSPSPRARPLAIVGESGSGKSVTSFAVMRILDRAGRIAEGSITFTGLDIRAASETEMRNLRGREMSMIFQNPRAALNPIRKVGRADRGRADAARAGGLAGRHRQGDRDPRAGAHRAPARALSRLSVRTVRRHVPAHRHRARARLPAAAPDRRRADHRPRRDHAEDRDGPGGRADHASAACRPS